ncbi:MAG TPA: 1,2-phenylacetyl-CoA epoxidase subunit PaaD [Acidimicrobiia bacterium]|nr:1,2-phenylacetyl-CoA epoxidase subunit PaaD [Acidimicrobiia bacterium]
MSRAPAVDVELARTVAASVVDPEIPVLTIADLGILREVSWDHGRVRVTITPTYSGCPAMGQIEDDLRSALIGAGFTEIEIATIHHPAWSSDWITAGGREKLAAFGIAPPLPDGVVLCPRCQSSTPRLVSRFGSTACKALMVCSSCGEPFDYFKEH